MLLAVFWNFVAMHGHMNIKVCFLELEYLLFESVLRPYKAQTTEHPMEAAAPSKSKTKESFNTKEWTF
jgi:hypothetical protein